MKIVLKTLVLGLVVTSATVAHAQRRKTDHTAELAAKLEPTRTIVYKTIGSRELRLHIFEPADWKVTDRRPCFIAMHGGGWVGGAPRRFYPIAEHFTKFGMVGISIEYRLAKPKAGITVFDCVQDARSAVRFVRSHAAELGIDPDKIIVSGGSAGGHLAASTAMFAEINAEGDDLSVSPIPNALILYYPVIDTSPAGYGNARIGERWRELSPVHRVQAGMPPTIVFHGTGDTVTPYAGAKAFHAAMLAAGNDCELITHEGGVHGYFIFDRVLYDQAMSRTVKFLASQGYLQQ